MTYLLDNLLAGSSGNLLAGRLSNLLADSFGNLLVGSSSSVTLPALLVTLCIIIQLAPR